MVRRFRYLISIRNNRDRQLIISGSILGIICITLFTNLAIMLTKPSSSDQNNTTKYIFNITSTNLPYIGTSTILSTTVISQTETLFNYTLPNLIEYEKYGHPLNNSLYFSYLLFCTVNGYVSSISLRLFTEWKGNASLYLFVVQMYEGNLRNILHRYPVKPQRNTTEWQTINIPFDVLPISMGYILGIGMQEKSDIINEIYAIKFKGVYSLTGLNINENTTNFTATINNNIGAAFSYTVILFT